MSQNQDIQGRESLDVAPTPQNTPLDTAVLANRPANLGRPQVEDIGEDEDEGEDVGAMNPASLLAQVCHSYAVRPSLLPDEVGNICRTVLMTRTPRYSLLLRANLLV
jgi:nucleosome assembly protein 1-like 1